MKNYLILFMLLFTLSSCGINNPPKPEGMPDKLYNKQLEIIKKSEISIKETNDAFPYDAHIDLANAASLLKSYKVAEQHYLLVLENMENNYLALNNLASMYEEMGKKQESLELFAKLTGFYPDSFEAIKDTLRLFKELKRNQVGLKALEHWIEFYPLERDGRFMQFTSQMFIYIKEDS